MNFSQSLYFSSNALNRQLSGMADEAFQEFGLTSSYAMLLMLVEDQPRIQPTQLSNKLQLTPSTITRLVEKMEYRGFVERSSSGRSTHIELTEKGENLQPKLRRAWNQLAEKYTGILGDRYTEVLTEMTAKASQQIKDVN